MRIKGTRDTEGKGLWSRRGTAVGVHASPHTTLTARTWTQGLAPSWEFKIRRTYVWTKKVLG